MSTPTMSMNAVTIRTASFPADALVELLLLIRAIR